MRFKTNLVIGVVFGALLAFVYLYEIKGGEERRQAAEQSKKILDINAPEVARLVVSNDKERIEIGREANGWLMLSPVRDEADSEAIDRYLRNLSESEREKTVVDSADALRPGVAGEYGLENPRLKVFIDTRQGPLDTLCFGDDAPTDRFTYVKTTGDNPKIDVVRAWRYDNLAKTSFDLRNRKVLNVAQGAVTALGRVSADMSDIVVTKNAELWQLKTPLSAMADSDSVDAMLRNIQNAEIVEFVNEKPTDKDLRQYGLTVDQAIRFALATKENATEVELFQGEKHEVDCLFIGHSDGVGRYYARNVGRSPVFLIDSTLVQQLSLSVFDLRDKNPIRFERDRVTTITIKRNGIFSFEASKDTSGLWSLKRPVAESAKSWKINALLTDLLDLKAQAFTKGRQSESILEIDLIGDQGRIVKLNFSSSNGEIVLGLPGEIEAYQINADSFADIDLDLDHVRQEATSVDTLSTR